MEQQAGGTLILFIIVLSILGLFVVLLFFIFIKRKNALIQNRIESERRYKEEIIKTQIEIREETLRNISWELHDNIGQLMTLAKIQVQTAKFNPEKIDEASQIIGKGLNELRTLSKAINPDTINNLKLYEAVKMELDRFNRLNFIASTLTVNGEKKIIDPKHSVILFRILQEFFSNTIKHSKGSKLDVILEYSDTDLKISAKDNGKGFDDSSTDFSGIGLKNMKSRAALIGADFKISSKVNQGTQVLMHYKF